MSKDAVGTGISDEQGRLRVISPSFKRLNKRNHGQKDSSGKGEHRSSNYIARVLEKKGVEKGGRRETTTSDERQLGRHARQLRRSLKERQPFDALRIEASDREEWGRESKQNAKT